ncbi:MAG TPA: alpha-amylase family protein [bacterium]
MQSRTLALACVLVTTALASAQNSSSVPREYEDLYAMLDSKVSAFDARVSRSWDGQSSDVQSAAELQVANCNRGRQLLNPLAFEGTKLELTRLQGLGVNAVTICIGFPLLYRPFFEFNGDPDDYERFIDFYRKLSAEVHRRNMKLIVESSILFGGVYSQGSGLNVVEYYKKLSEPDIVAARVEVARTIIREAQPDYLNLGSEPDTQGKLTGRPDLSTPDGFSRMTAYLVEQLRAAGVGKTQLGAGIGTWQRFGETYLKALCGTGIDFVDLHVYPVNRDLLDKLITYTDQAHACGKPVAISEAWLQKQRDSEFTQIDAVFDNAIYARDTFSFWSPLDQKFLMSLVKFAHWKRLSYLSPFWSKFFWAYLDYDEVGRLSKQDLMTESARASAAGIRDGNVTLTGVAYKAAIAKR